MANIDDEIRSMIESFAADISAVVRRKALDAVASVLGNGAAAPRLKSAESAGRAHAAPRAKAAPAAKSAAPKAASKKAARAPGAKRPPLELVKLTDKLASYIQANPGARMEAIAKALATPTRDLNLPVKKLLAGKKIRVQGHKRATEYFPA